jgi:sarcosine oxidase gamma subunit
MADFYSAVDTTIQRGANCKHPVSSARGEQAHFLAAHVVERDADHAMVDLSGDGLTVRIDKPSADDCLCTFCKIGVELLEVYDFATNDMAVRTT